MFAATRIAPSSSCLIGFIAILLVPAGLARGQEKAAEQSLFVTVRNPITSEEFSRVKAISSSAREHFQKAGQKGKLLIVYDFNPDNQPVGTSLFGPCLDLADFILTQPDVRSIAFVHGKVTRHTVLPVLACQEIVMAPGDNVGIGDVLPDLADQPPGNLEQFYQDRRVQSYQDITRHRGRAGAVAVKMLDRNMVVLKASRTDGSPWYIDARLKDDKALKEKEKLDAVQTDPVAIPAGAAGFYNGERARTLGLSVRSDLKTRQDVKTAYDMPDSALREDPLEGRNPVAWRLEISGSFDQAMKETVTRRLSRMVSQGANFIIVELSCAGGDPVVARSIGERLSTLKDNSGQHPVMTVAYVTPQARDLAVFVAMGCTEIVMARGAKLGDFENYLRKMPEAKFLADELESQAKAHDYPPLLARAMVDRDLVVYEVRPKANREERRYVTAEVKDEPQWASAEPLKAKERGKLLVLNADDARRLGFARHQAEDIGQLYERYGLIRSQVKDSSPDWLDRFAEFLRTPMMEMLVVMFGIACLILELKVPGISLPGILAAVCFILFFWAHAQLAFLWLAMLLFILGLVLIALEIFVMPGVAVLGASGVVLMLSGLALATLDHLPHTESEWLAAGGSMTRFGLGLVGAIALAIGVARYLPNIPYANRFMLVPPADRLEDVSDTSAQVEAARRAGLLGAIGVAATTLRPSGMVRFGDEFLDVVAEGSYVETGTRVQIIEIEGNRIVVKEV